MKGFHKIFFVIIAVIILLVIGIRFAMMARAWKRGGVTYEITVSTYNGHSDVYYTSQYRESGNCIVFKDEFNIEKKVCGNYQVRKW